MKTIKKTIFLTSLLLLTGTIQAAEPPGDPILRPNTLMHTASINQAAMDKNQSFLVTAADDKTAKLWALSSGKLLQTLRVPIGEGNEGRLYAAAVAPNGKWVALGGYTGYQWDKKHAVYLFAGNSGKITRRLDNIANVINELCVNSDGSRLAATLGKQGVHVWNSKNWQTAWKDSRYDNEAASYGCDFAVDGRLATTAHDGYLRVYDNRGKLLKKSPLQAGKKPMGVAFSPDGKRLAVGFQDSTQVVVYDSHSLLRLFPVNTYQAPKGGLYKVAWSPDGSSLYAGGWYRGGGSGNSIMRFPQGGTGRAIALPGSQNTVTDLLPLFDGGVIATAADPTWLQLTNNGSLRQQHRSVTVDNRNKLGDNLLLMNDGKQVAFGLAFGQQQPVGFSVSGRQLIPLNANWFQGLKAQGFTAAKTQASTFAVRDWQNNYRPLLNGRALPLDKGERSRSLAIAPNKNSFLLGTNNGLKRFNSQGKQQWQTDTAGTVWGVNLSADGKLAVAAVGDGTIRWYRYSDGKELLALLIDKHSKEWILWTPSGYYDASAGGDKLIGWHLNNGKDKTPDFYPAKTLRKKFYRPQVVGNILSTLDEQKAIQLANRQGEQTNGQQTVESALPPTVNILSHRNGDRFDSESIVLQVAVSRNNEKADFKVLVDGLPMQKNRGLKPIKKQGNRSLTVYLPPRDVTLSVIAENALGASPPATVRLRWAGGVAGNQTAETTAKPKLYILAIGVSNYREPHLKLGFPVKDAKDFVNVLKRQEGKLYGKVKSKLLADAGKADILNGLAWLRKNATDKDVTMLFLSGHGVNDRDNNYRFVATDSDVQKLYSTGVSYSDIKETLVNLSGKRLAFIDTCHSGNVFGSRKHKTTASEVVANVITPNTITKTATETATETAVAKTVDKTVEKTTAITKSTTGTSKSATKGLAKIADINGITNDLTAAENGIVVFASSRGNQLSIEDTRWGNGAFTKAVVEGLSGKADYTNDGTITINQLDLYISERVKALTNNRQTPVTAKPDTLPDFPIGVVR